MPISEAQLTVWSNPGALASAEATHTSIKAALKAHTWPTGMSYDTYLQGSYGNHTNIRGNSDVDLVVQGVGDIFYSNVPADRWQAYGFYKGAFEFAEFKTEVWKALSAYYGSSQVDDTSSDKCLIVKPASGRLSADAIPCLEYRCYSGTAIAETGMTFFSRAGQIINYPKLHLKNGEQKNLSTSTRFKSMVRIFKNAREALGTDAGSYSSYFIECLLYNVPDGYFRGNLGAAFQGILGYLLRADLTQFKTQNRQEDLFGPGSTQWRVDDARRFINALINLWNAS